jgi:hypothetical protein
MGGGADRTRTATNTTTTKTNDPIDASDASNEAAAMIAPVLLHFSEGEEDLEDPTGYDSPRESDELEEDDDLFSLNGNKEKDETGLSTYGKLHLANIKKNKNRLREMGLHKNTPPPKKRPPRKLKPKEFEPVKRNPIRTSRTSNNLKSDAPGRVDVTFEVPASMDASRADTSLVLVLLDWVILLDLVQLDLAPPLQLVPLQLKRTLRPLLLNWVQPLVLMSTKMISLPVVDMIPKKLERNKKLRLSF